MPRPATKRHPIRALRRIIGKTQAGFAQTIGVSPTWLKQIENRERKLSPRTARRILAETGADDKQLLKGKLCRVGGGKYVENSYKRWKSHYTKQGPEDAKRCAINMAGWSYALFRASLGRGRLWQLRESLLDALIEARAAFNLGPLVDGILKREAPEQFGEAPENESGWYPQGEAPRELLRQLFPEQSPKSSSK
jgi:transcriptional regulator with XRE-family HTH domain